MFQFPHLRMQTFPEIISLNLVYILSVFLEKITA
uniref:Uncharacterized protein n=1 Tax=Rhizophora mucronata TaxID=61149 RepID=A0A2P2QUL4_RHIMU